MEIERKFLVTGFPEETKEPYVKLLNDLEMYQGYLSTNPDIRIRSVDYADNFYINYVFTMKSDGDLSRDEYEFNINRDQFESLKNMIKKPFIHKISKTYQLNNFNVLQVNLVDEGTENEFYYAEIEFASIKDAEEFDMSKYPFLLKDVTYDMKYKMKNYWNRTRNIEEINKSIKNTIENWEDWKKEEYNNNFAVSKYSKKLKI